MGPLSQEAAGFRDELGVQLKVRVSKGCIKRRLDEPCATRFPFVACAKRTQCQHIFRRFFFPPGSGKFPASLDHLAVGTLHFNFALFNSHF